MMIIVGVHVTMNSLSLHGLVLSSRHAIFVLELIHEKPRRYTEIRKLLRGHQKMESKSAHFYYLRKLMAINAIRLQRSIHTDISLIGIYEITERGKMLYKLVKQVEIEMKLQDSQKELTLLAKNQMNVKSL